MKSIVCIFCICILAACQPKHESITIDSSNGSELMVCDVSLLGEVKDLKLSELIEDFEIIHFDNRDEALFKHNWMYFSDNYMCVKQPRGTVKLFDKTGKLIGDVGSFGQGPGEYQSIMDILIDEPAGFIYIAPFVGKSILKYNLKGEYLSKIDFEERLNKPRLFLNEDPSFSLVNLCFKDMDNKFVGVNIQTANNKEVKYAHDERLLSNFKNQAGQNVGFNNEIWSYRNAPNFPFMYTHTDTLYHYNSLDNKFNARFALKINKDKTKYNFLIFHEFPKHYLTFIVGGDPGTLVVNKNSHDASYVRIINDYLGNIDASLRFQDGYYYWVYEPMDLKEKLEEHLLTSICPKDQVEKLKKIISTLNENDNNVIIRGKLKK